MLEFYLGLVPVIAERAVETVQITHSVPWKMGGSCKEMVYFVRFQAEFQPHSLGDGFCCHACERHVHSMESHPVDFFRPSVPVPIWSRVAECADIQEVTQLIRGYGFFFPVRPCRRDIQLTSAPAYHGTTSFTEVFVHRIADGTRAAALKCEFAACRFDLVAIQTVCCFRTHLK